MSFEEYLLSKKIESESFKKNDSNRFHEWEKQFTQMHPDSFTTQKKFLINDVRRQYPLP